MDEVLERLRRPLASERLDIDELIAKQDEEDYELQDEDLEVNGSCDPETEAQILKDLENEDPDDAALDWQALSAATVV